MKEIDSNTYTCLKKWSHIQTVQMRNINFVFESKLKNFTASGIKRIFCDISFDDYNDDDGKKTQQKVISLITKLYFLIYLFFLLIREWGKNYTEIFALYRLLPTPSIHRALEIEEIDKRTYHITQKIIIIIIIIISSEWKINKK